MKSDSLNGNTILPYNGLKSSLSFWKRITSGKVFCNDTQVMSGNFLNNICDDLEVAKLPFETEYIELVRQLGGNNDMLSTGKHNISQNHSNLQI